MRLHPKHHRVLTNVMHAAWRSMAFVFALLRVNWWVFRIFVAIYSFWYFHKFIHPFLRFVVCLSSAISSRVSYSFCRSFANEIRFLNVRRAPFLSIYCRLSYLVASLINTDECVHIKVSLYSLSENYSSRKRKKHLYILFKFANFILLQTHGSKKKYNDKNSKLIYIVLNYGKNGGI